MTKDVKQEIVQMWIPSLILTASLMVLYNNLPVGWHIIGSLIMNMVIVGAMLALDYRRLGGFNEL